MQQILQQKHPILLVIVAFNNRTRQRIEQLPQQEAILAIATINRPHLINATVKLQLFCLKQDHSTFSKRVNLMDAKIFRKKADYYRNQRMMKSTNTNI